MTQIELKNEDMRKNNKKGMKKLKKDILHEMLGDK